MVRCGRKLDIYPRVGRILYLPPSNRIPTAHVNMQHACMHMHTLTYRKRGADRTGTGEEVKWAIALFTYTSGQPII